MCVMTMTEGRLSEIEEAYKGLEGRGYTGGVIRELIGEIRRLRAEASTGIGEYSQCCKCGELAHPDFMRSYAAAPGLWTTPCEKGGDCDWAAPAPASTEGAATPEPSEADERAAAAVVVALRLPSGHGQTELTLAGEFRRVRAEGYAEGFEAACRAATMYIRQRPTVAGETTAELRRALLTGIRALARR